MPKRSNDFQRLIKRVYDQLAPVGATVSESASLPEYGASDGPEIDILVEFPLEGFGQLLRIAIECRDQKRRGDKEWINELIGKYRDVHVDRVIAVSRTAFTRGAKTKARQAKIELMTLHEAIEANWPTTLLLIRVYETVLYPEIGRVAYDATPPWPGTGEPTSVLIGTQELSQTDFKRWLGGQIAKAYDGERQHQKRAGNTALDGPGRHDVVLGVECENLVFIAPGGTRHRITNLRTHSSAVVVERRLPVSRYRFGNVGVTEGAVVDGGRPATITVVEEPGKPISMKVVPH